MCRNASCSTCWLDHISTSNNSLINNINISYETTLEDHIPLNFVLTVPNHARPIPYICSLLQDICDVVKIMN